MKEGIDEYLRSFAIRNLRKPLTPEIKVDDLIPAPACVRTQTIKDDGNMMDVFSQNYKKIHFICIAPSPEATTSIKN
ncbi:hypothetical protein FQP34_01540 [Peribacillus simplex]|uniref:Uncharacterized protein n=1 Tax=Peribacillus simplex TaxID=1478 RepID=A0A8B5Y4E0_9BACI|nr:hypothetical protein [Peribacillus simplex]TVX83936.1 hypothetical protein FQP34_01540 [Peribacillus simplex]